MTSMAPTTSSHSFISPVADEKSEKSIVESTGKEETAASGAAKKEATVKIFKQHMEILKLQESLEEYEQDKKELEEEVKNKS